MCVCVYVFSVYVCVCVFVYGVYFVYYGRLCYYHYHRVEKTCKAATV